ncbi:hypothetical protein [Agarilytica rhodophyticola]|uniref:hypothetical protein n=1 Tax=Agarilytica rhodophyticola TaxID=1737490 RepID=UPI001319CBA6|nr:hypothetical protein [Agarilytica rhodophyticola]
MKLFLIKFLSLITIFSLSHNVFSQVDIDCFSHAEAAFILDKAKKNGAAELKEAEQSILNACNVTEDTGKEEKEKILQAQLALSKQAKIFINNTGSVFYEAIDSCGYHPQRRESTCSIEVRQRFGFGGTPASGPGSFEWMAFCVYNLPSNPNRWTLANISAVHVHDEAFGAQPNWYYTITDQAETRLHSTPVDGRTYIAKNILSWGIRPRSCNFNPVWGNEAYYRIKLDP